MLKMIKYPRTQHIEGSRLQKGDEDLDGVRFRDLKGQHLVVEEKIDGLVESKKRLSRDLLEGSAELNLTELKDEELLRLVALDLDAAIKE